MPNFRAAAAVLVTLAATLPGQPPGVQTTALMQQTLADTPESKMSLFFLNVAPGATLPTHSHAGAVFAYVIAGDIENQVEPDPPATYHPGGFFEERPKQVHRLLRNLSQTAPAKILILQNTGSLPATVKPLLQESIDNLSHREVTVLIQTIAPGVEASIPQHPVFAYVLRGEVMDGGKSYRAGEAFFAPENRGGMLRNAGKTAPAELLLFQLASAEKPAWETLLRAPLPEDAEPKISVFSIPVGPAPPTPREAGPGHRHAGPVFAYILQGEIENQVEPDPPQVYTAGGFFYEAPMHLHRFLRNRSQTEPAKLIVFQAGNTGQAAPVIKLLLEEPLRTTAKQEVSLFRLSVAAGGAAEAPAQLGTGVVYVLEGKIEIAAKDYSAGDLVAVSDSSPGLIFKNAGAQPAKVLLYQAGAAR